MSLQNFQKHQFQQTCLEIQNCFDNLNSKIESHRNQIKKEQNNVQQNSNDIIQQLNRNYQDIKQQLEDSRKNLGFKIQIQNISSKPDNANIQISLNYSGQQLLSKKQSKLIFEEESLVEFSLKSEKQIYGVIYQIPKKNNDNHDKSNDNIKNEKIESDEEDLNNDKQQKIFDDFQIEIDVDLINQLKEKKSIIKNIHLNNNINIYCTVKIVLVGSGTQQWLRSVGLIGNTVFNEINQNKVSITFVEDEPLNLSNDHSQSYLQSDKNMIEESVKETYQQEQSQEQYTNQENNEVSINQGLKEQQQEDAIQQELEENIDDQDLDQFKYKAQQQNQIQQQSGKKDEKANESSSSKVKVRDLIKEQNEPLNVVKEIEKNIQQLNEEDDDVVEELKQHKQNNNSINNSLNNNSIHNNQQLQQNSIEIIQQQVIKKEYKGKILKIRMKKLSNLQQEWDFTINSSMKKGQEQPILDMHGNEIENQVHDFKKPDEDQQIHFNFNFDVNLNIEEFKTENQSDLQQVYFLFKIMADDGKLEHVYGWLLHKTFKDNNELNLGKFNFNILSFQQNINFDLPTFVQHKDQERMYERLEYEILFEL